MTCIFCNEKIINSYVEINNNPAHPFCAAIDDIMKMSNDLVDVSSEFETNINKENELITEVINHFQM